MIDGGCDIVWVVMLLMLMDHVGFGRVVELIPDGTLSKVWLRWWLIHVVYVVSFLLLLSLDMMNDDDSISIW